MADESNSGVVIVTLRDVYDEVAALREDVRPLVSAVPDHEKRLRVVEKLQYALPPTFILAVASAVQTWRSK